MRVRESVRVDTGVLLVGLCGMGVPPMLHGRDAHATWSARTIPNPYESAPRKPARPPLYTRHRTGL